MKIVIATHNEHKLHEIRENLRDTRYEFISLDEYPQINEIEETGDTLLENSFIKARTVSKITKLPAMADDTGLEVDFLNGAPGVKSARFAGENTSSLDNVKLLLDKLKDVPVAKRTARFRTVMSLIIGNKEYWVEGVAEGRIIDELKGEQGFGYDPIFYYPPLEKTFAELSMEQKNKISHRGLALQKFRILLGKINLGT